MLDLFYIVHYPYRAPEGISAPNVRKNKQATENENGGWNLLRPDFCSRISRPKSPAESPGIGQFVECASDSLSGLVAKTRTKFRDFVADNDNA
jgi:hypothetical protein